MNQIYFFSTMHSGTCFFTNFFENHKQIDAVCNPRHYRRKKLHLTNKKCILHDHAPYCVKNVLRNPDFHVRKVIATLRDPVKSMISRVVRSKREKTYLAISKGALVIAQLKDAFFMPIDLDVNRVHMLRKLCEYCEIDVTPYVLKTAREWKPRNSVKNEHHERLTSIYALGGLDALVQEMPMPFLEIKRNMHILLPFYTNQGYDLNW